MIDYFISIKPSGGNFIKQIMIKYWGKRKVISDYHIDEYRNRFDTPPEVIRLTPAIVISVSPNELKEIKNLIGNVNVLHSH